MDIRVPNLGEGAESGAVVAIYVKEGDKVAKDQTIIELENEKAVAPIPSTESGVVQKIYVKVGQKISVGQAILALAGSGESSAPAAAAPQKPAPKASGEGHGRAPYQPVPGIPYPASPSVRRLAQELGVDLANIGSGGGKQAPAPEQIDFSKWGPVTKKPFSSLRQKIAERMVLSWTTIPHVTQFDEADITKLSLLRKTYAPAYEKKGVKLTLTSFVMKAVVAALKKYPQFNSSLDEVSQEVVMKQYIHLGIAVDSEAGLMVPVIRDVDKKSLLELSKDLEVAAEKTRTRKISADEMKGGSFTISNLGGIGGTHFTPIINKPEVAILGVGRGVGKLPLSLSYDHRVIDGADGARFIRAIAEALENFDEKDVKI